MSSEVSNAAYRYALAFYVIFAGYFFYVFHALGIFLATHYFPQNASGYSVVNPNFSFWNNSIASALTLVIVFIMFANSKLKEYVVDVGDELTRVSWSDLKETRHATLIVIALCLVSSAFLFTADLIFMRLVNFIMGTAA